MPGTSLRHELAVVLGPFDADGVDFLDVAVASPTNFLVLMRYCARVVAEFGGGFLLAVVELVDLGPLRPGIVGGALQRRLGQNLELHEALAAVAHGGADAVGAGVAAADDDDVLALGGDESAVGVVRVEQAFGVGVQKLHGEMDALELAALDRQIARLGRAAAEDDGVEVAAQFVGGIVDADFAVGDELDPFGFHQLDAAQDDVLLVELHVGDAVHEQAADAIGALEDRDASGRPC